MQASSLFIVWRRPGAYPVNVELRDDLGAAASIPDVKLVLQSPTLGEALTQNHQFHLGQILTKLTDFEKDRLRETLERVFDLGMCTGHQLDLKHQWLPSEFAGYSPETIAKAMK